MPLNRMIVLAARPKGEPAAETFRLVSQNLADPGEGEVLVRHHYLSLDPYMRGRMNDVKSYAAVQALDAVMGGGAVGEVIASKNPRFAVGDHVVGMGGWQEYSLSDGKGWQKIDARRVPMQTFLGPLGMPGVTAWHGVTNIIAPKAGETIVVSAATGAVGSVAGQLATLAGARVIGIAGGAEKCAYAVSDLGYGACIDHRAADFPAQLAAATPKGIDGVFENVGGRPLDLSFKRLNDFGRVAVCGLVASGYDGTPTPLSDVTLLVPRRLKVQGFIVTDHLDLWPQALTELGALVAQGKLTWRESVAQGIAAAPAAFIAMLKGQNFGKQLVKLV